jgi:hypothetical protein
MTWERESIMVLVKATPNWSTTSGRYTICTAGVNKNGELRRLYPMFWQTIKSQGIKVWDEISFDASEPEKDSRPESRKIKNESVRNLGCAIEDREERRDFLRKLEDAHLPDATKRKKTLSLVRPILFGFSVDKREETINQATLYGGIFRKRPYDDVGIYYEFKCGEKGCDMCSEVGKFHKMECFDFGVNELYRKYEDEKEAREKVHDMCFVRMKTDFDCWFAMGTHSRYPFLKWMIVGLLWMKRKQTSTN